MKILLKYLKPYKMLIGLALLLAAINQVFSLLDPLIFGKIIDQFASHPFVENIKDSSGNIIQSNSRTSSEYYKGVLVLLFASVGVAMVSRIAKAFQDYVVNVIIQKFGANIFTIGLQHAMQLPYQDFEDQRSGETLSILSKVRQDTEKFIASFINVLFAVLVGVVFVAVYAFSKHWSIVPAYFIGVFLLTILTNFLSKKIKEIQKKIVKETNTLAGSTTESLRNIELLKSLGLTEQEVKRLNQNTYKILGLELRKVKSLRALSFIQGTFVNSLRQVIMFILLWLIFNKELTVGELITLQFYSFFIFGPLQEIGNIIISYREAEASIQNFDELMKKEPEKYPKQPEGLEVIKTLQFKDVLFKHKSTNEIALQHINFKVKQGDTIAFVGPSGSGKTTLVKLLVGLYKPAEGEIFYNDINEDKIDFNVFRQQIGFVTQDTQLFAGTIKENLLFVNPKATEDEMLDAMQKASCKTLLSRANNGLDSIIGEGGIKISGGEKQRLSIARALLRKPQMLIFDEATSALDSLTEEQITDTIRNISEDKSQITIMIAHRLSTIMHADTIYVLEQGEIVEQGNHEKLLEEKGLYYAMWRQQIGERKNIIKPENNS